LLNGEEGAPVRTTLTGVQVGVDVSASDKVWRTFQAIGNIAFAYAYSNVLIEIQVNNYNLYSLILIKHSAFACMNHIYILIIRIWRNMSNLNE